MTEKNEKLVFTYLLKQYKKDFMIFLEDYFNTKTNYIYFMTLNNKFTNGSDSYHSKSMRANFRFRKVFVALEEDIDVLKENYDDLKSLLPKNSESANKIFLETLQKSKLTLVKNIEILSFVQKEMNYLLDSYPLYPPTAALYRTRQDLKSFIWLRNLFKDFSNILVDLFIHQSPDGKKLFDEENIIIGWSANDENKFLKRFNNALFMFDGSYTLLNRQSAWVIIFHEAIHYMLRLLSTQDDHEHIKKSKASINTKDFLEKYGKAKRESMRIIWGFFSENTIRIDYSNIYDAFDDIFCDALLTSLLGETYFLPLFSFLLLSSPSGEISENLYNITVNDTIWLRLYVASKFIKEDKHNLNLKQFLINYKKHIFLYSSKQSREILNSDIDLADALYGNFEYIICKKFKPEIDEVKSSLKKSKFCQLYLKSSEYVITTLLKNIKSDEDFDTIRSKEGRIISSSLQAFKENLNVDDLKPYFNKLCETSVIKLSFIKVRSDGYRKYPIEDLLKNFIKQHNEENKSFLFFNMGDYTFLKFDLFDDKSKREDEIDNTIAKIRESHLCRPSPEKMINTETFKEFVKKYNSIFKVENGFVECQKEITDMALENYLQEELSKEEKGLIRKFSDRYKEVSNDYILSKKNEISGPILDTYKKAESFFNFAKDHGLVTIQIQTDFEAKGTIDDYLKEIRDYIESLIDNLKKEKDVVKSPDSIKYLTFTPSDWSDFVLLISGEDKDYKGILSTIKNIVHTKDEYHSFRTITDLSFGCYDVKKFPNITVPNPHFLCRFSSENTDTKNFDKDLLRKLKISQKALNINKLCGSYDIDINFFKKKHLTAKKTYEFFSELAKLTTNTDKTEEKKPYFSDIQIKITTPHEIRL